MKQTPYLFIIVINNRVSEHYRVEYMSNEEEAIRTAATMNVTACMFKKSAGVLVYSLATNEAEKNVWQLRKAMNVNNWKTVYEECLPAYKKVYKWNPAIIKWDINNQSTENYEVLS